MRWYRLNSLNSVFYSIQEIETASPNAKITANSANSSQNKTLIHYKFIGTTCGRSRPIVWWSRGWIGQDLCIFTTLISQQNRNTRRNSLAQKYISNTIAFQHSWECNLPSWRLWELFIALQNVIHANHAKFAYGVFVSVDRIEVSNYLLDHRVLFGFFFVFCED